MAKWVARRIQRVHMSVIGSTQTAGRPRATAPPRRAKTGIRKRESGRVAKKPAGKAENLQSGIRRQNPQPATESEKARIGRSESDREGRNRKLQARNPARRLSAWKGDGQNQIEKAETEKESENQKRRTRIPLEPPHTESFLGWQNR